MRKTLISLSATAIFMAMGSAHAAPVASGGIFNMYSQLGRDSTTPLIAAQATVNVDPTISGWVDQAAGTWGVSSATLFFGLPWTASNGTLITTAGDYAINTATGVVAAASTSGDSNDGSMHFTVGVGQVAALIDFAYGATTGIRVVDIWNVNIDGSLTAAYVPGMENGPFPGFNAAFNLSSPGLISVGWFSLTPLSGVVANTLQTSNQLTVSGVAVNSVISIVGGAYSKNGTAYTAANGTVSNNDTVTVQHTSSSTPGGSTTTSLTIAGVTKPFTSTTFLPVTTPSVFSFASQSGVSLNTITVSNSITVAGINTATTISVTGGEYSINGGTYISTPGTVTNGQTVVVRHTSANSNVAAVNTVLNIGGVTSTFTSTTKAANSIPFTAAFTMLDISGSNVGRDTAVTGTYDDTNINTSSTDTKFNMTLQSAVPFFGSPWVAHDIRVFGPGTYSVNTACTAAEIRANGGAACAASGTALTFTVNSGQLGAHILFDWNGNNDIDVAQVWNTDYSASAVPASAGIVYKFATQDGNGDGIAGFPMVAGPFVGFNANFDIKFANYTILTTTQEGYAISSWVEVASSTLASGMPANFTAGSGGVQFVVTLPGGQTTATIVLSAPNLKANDKAYWVDGSGVYHEITGAIYDYTAKTVTYMVTDGGFGDTDSVVGTISDPVIILSPVSQLASSSGGGGGGCAISGNSPFDPVLPGSLLLALSWLGWRRAKQH